MSAVAIPGVTMRMSNPFRESVSDPHDATYVDVFPAPTSIWPKYVELTTSESGVDQATLAKLASYLTDLSAPRPVGEPVPLSTGGELSAPSSSDDPA